MFLELINSAPSIAKEWSRVYDLMRVHTQGATPLHIFNDRRPMESRNNYSLDYRLSNYRAITMSSFEQAIDSYVETASNLDVKVDVDSATLMEKISSIFIGDGIKKYSVKDYVVNAIGRLRQTDPNALLVVLPKHPFENITPSYNTEIPLFQGAALTKEVGIDIKVVYSSAIKYVDADNLLFEAGQWEYDKGLYKPYYYGINKDTTFILYPKKGDSIEYVEQEFYSNALSKVPFIAIASKQVYSDGIAFFVPEFLGAAYFGDLAIGQNSDLQICEVRYTFPIKYEVRRECTNQLAYTCPTTGKHLLRDTNHVCGECGGVGFITDSSPLGTYFINQKTGIDADANQELKAPIGFVTPPSDILKHSADRVDYYLSKMKDELCLIAQNTTNQSGESKRYDMMQKVTMVTNIVTDIYRIYGELIGVIGGFLERKEVQVKLTFPDDFDIKNASDILTDIIDAKKANLPEVALRQMTIDFFVKKFGEAYRSKIEFLEKVDKLFIYGVDDLVKAKAIFGDSITNRDLAIHAFGFDVIKDIDTTDFNTAKALFDSRIEPYVTPTPSL